MLVLWPRRTSPSLLRHWFLQIIVEGTTVGKAGHRNHEVATRIANQTLNSAFIVALARTTVPIINHLVGQHRADPLGAFEHLIRHDLGNKALVIIVKDRLGNCAKNSNA